MDKISLKELIQKELSDDISDFSWVTEREYELLSELKYNPNNTYPITKEMPMNIEFRDDLDRINITKGRINGGHIEIKLYWIDQNGAIRMDSPPEVTPKTMNTHLRNLLDHFLPNGSRFLLQPNDPIRFRLFQLLLNRWIDKEVWNIRLDHSKSHILLYGRT